MNAFEFPLHFLRPWWWLALAPLPLALWMLALSGGGRAALARLADAALLSHLVRDTGTRRWAALGVVALAWLLAVAALAGPAWQKVATPLYVNGAARVVVLSLSDDMLAADLKPDRITRARFAVHDLLEDAGDARTALVAYAGAAFTVAPLTDDKRTVENFLSALQPDIMPAPGNDAAAGIRQGIRLLQQSHVKGGEIVLVTDNAGGAAVAAARGARAQGIRVDVLGIGTTEGAPVPRSGGGFAGGPSGVLMARRDDAALRAVAAAGGGRYAVLHADGSGVAALGAPVAAAGHASGGERAQVWRDGGVWLLPALLVLAALAFRRGWLLALAVLVLPVGMPVAHAASWQSWFSNRDQRAAQALAHGDAAAAGKLATTPGLRGAAEYRAGDYAGAAKAFAAGSDARASYNLGNALAKQGAWDKSIAAYEQALEQDPDMADARANLAAVEQWLKQHPPPPSSGGQGKSRGKQGQHPSGAGSSSSPQGTQQPSSSSAGQQGPASSAESRSQSSGSSQHSNAGRQSGGQDKGEAHGQQGPSAGEAEAQRQQAQQARQGLSQELQKARRAQGSGRPTGAFALGQRQPDDGGRFDGEQRAMLNAVPDDPGALLRRKFRLEWEQRQGQPPQEDGQP